jgi:hypothetical protein
MHVHVNVQDHASYPLISDDVVASERARFSHTRDPALCAWLANFSDRVATGGAHLICDGFAITSSGTSPTHNTPGRSPQHPRPLVPRVHTHPSLPHCMHVQHAWCK